MSTGFAIASSIRICAARRILSCVPSGKTTRLGARCALWMIIRIISWLRPSRRSSRSRYSSRFNWIWATPVSIAARATAGATYVSTRESKGFGIM